MILHLMNLWRVFDMVKCRFGHKKCTGEAEMKNKHGVDMCKVCHEIWVKQPPIERDRRGNAMPQFKIHSFRW